MNVEVTCYGAVRETVGEKRLERALPDGASVGDLLAALAAEFEAFDPGDVGRAGIVVMVDGRNVRQLDGMATTLEDGDAVSLSGSAVPE